MEAKKEPETPGQRAALMARSGATNEEIATVVGLKRWELRQMGKRLELERATRRFELRKAQTELALAGNEPMLRVLGEIELEQAKKDRIAQGQRLPDLVKYPDTGYPPGDARVLVMTQNRRVLGEDFLRFARFVAAYARLNPGASWVACLRGIAEAWGVELVPANDDGIGLEQVLAGFKLSGNG
jgi:hypothetical protein